MDLGILLLFRLIILLWHHRVIQQGFWYSKLYLSATYPGMDNYSTGKAIRFREANSTIRRDIYKSLITQDRFGVYFSLFIPATWNEFY